MFLEVIVEPVVVIRSEVLAEAKPVSDLQRHVRSTMRAAFGIQEAEVALQVVVSLEADETFRGTVRSMKIAAVLVALVIVVDFLVDVVEAFEDIVLEGLTMDEGGAQDVFEAALQAIVALTAFLARFKWKF